MTELDSRTRKGRCVIDLAYRAWRCAPLNSFFITVSSLLPPLPLRDQLIHCLVFGLQLSVPYKIFVEITDRKTDWLENIKIQMCLYNDNKATVKQE